MYFNLYTIVNAWRTRPIFSPTLQLDSRNMCFPNFLLIESVIIYLSAMCRNLSKVVYFINVFPGKKL